jgi:tetratricopeptide (TPR) repeat protein
VKHAWIAAVGLVSALAAADSLELVFRKAAEALAANDLVSAESGFREVLKAQPANVGALGNLGVVYSRMDRPAEAIAVYGRALEIAPGEPGLWLNLGLAHLKQEDYAAAKPLFEKLDASRGASAQSRELLATCRIYTGEAAAGLEALEALPASSSVSFLRAVGELKLKRRDRAQAIFGELLASAPPAQAQFLLGKAYAENTLAEEAATAFRKAAELDPKLPGVHLELGKALISLRANAGAEQALRLALAEGANPSEAAYYLGALLTVSGRHAEAVPFLEKARQARPDGWGAYYYLGRAHLQAGRSTAAIPLLERAAKLNPNEGAVHYQLARALQSAGRTADASQARARVAALKTRAARDEQEVFANR